MKSSSLLVFLAFTPASCNSVPDQRSIESPWSQEFAAPRLMETSRMRLEPLQPRFNDLDYKAAQGSRDHLSTTLQWDGWPSSEMTAEQNLGDLKRHFKEFTSREAYAYTVLHPSGDPCIGCVYLNSDKENPRGLRMAYWVTEDQLAESLDEHLVATVLEMIDSSWPVDLVAISHPVENSRGLAILARLGLEKVGESEKQVAFVWRR